MKRPKHRLRKPPRLATDSSDWERFTKSILATFAAFALFGGLGVLTHTPAPEPRVSLQASAEPPRIEPIPLVPPITDSLMFRPRRVPVIPVVEKAPLASYDSQDRHERKVERHESHRDNDRADRREHHADRDGHRADRDHHRGRADKGHGRHRADNHRGRHRADSGHRGGRDHSGSHHGGGGHGSHGGGHHSGGHSGGGHSGHHGGGHGGRH